MEINIEYINKNIVLHFNEFVPIIKLNKKFYLIIRDNFAKINKIILPSGTQLSPSVIPNWIPICFVEIPKEEINESIKIFDTFKDNTDCKLYILNEENKIPVINFELEYIKITNEKNCPRYLLYKVSNVIQKDYSYLVNEDNKLIAIEYGKNEDDIYYLPLYLIKKALNNTKVLSLRFTDKPIKINKKKIKNNKIFHRSLNNYICVDSYLLMEGKLNSEIKVEYQNETVISKYYEIDSINDIILNKDIKEKHLGKIQFINLLEKYC